MIYLVVALRAPKPALQDRPRRHLRRAGLGRAARAAHAAWPGSRHLEFAPKNLFRDLQSTKKKPSYPKCRVYGLLFGLLWRSHRAIASQAWNMSQNCIPENGSMFIIVPWATLPGAVEVSFRLLLTIPALQSLGKLKRAQTPK